MVPRHGEEASEAYIKTQAHEGWRLLPEQYEDDGLSGVSLERPALQRLFDVSRDGVLDTAVVYKVNRLKGKGLFVRPSRRRY